MSTANLLSTLSTLRKELKNNKSALKDEEKIFELLDQLEENLKDETPNISKALELHRDIKTLLEGVTASAIVDAVETLGEALLLIA